MKSKLVVVDYGVCNFKSIINMAQRIGYTVEKTEKKEDLLSADKIILPGVGAFDHGISKLTEFGYFDNLKTAASMGTPILGICLGMQLLGRSSQEGKLKGLELLDFHCEKFQVKSNIRIPHVGWNYIIPKKKTKLLGGLDSYKFYFTHSYHAVASNKEIIGATCNHGYEFPCILEHKNIYGVQFHPEKSHKFGYDLLKNFLAL